VYSPTNNRIYFVPYWQAVEAGKNWNYVDCDSGNVLEYIHTLTTLPVSGAYIGGVYSPTNNRIYFVPYWQADEAGKNWHYVDCDSGNIIEYIHTLTTLPVNYAYSGGMYSPTNNRIYFVPSGQADEAGKNWLYVSDTSGEYYPPALFANGLFNKL
jgi:hypothetical protein